MNNTKNNTKRTVNKRTNTRSSAKPASRERKSTKTFSKKESARRSFRKTLEEQVDSIFMESFPEETTKIVPVTENEYKFEDFNLCEKTQKALVDAGYVTATEIQAQTIPLILNGKDVIGQSKTGTGKTASYALPAIEKINSLDKSTQVLVLCPTRELAVQVADEIRKFMKYQERIRTLAIYGGQSIENQIRTLKRGVQIVIGTPGRIMDHMRRKTLSLDKVHTVVLDEADEMLNMGFEEDIETILKEVPEERQTVLFSATMNKRILGIANKYLKDPTNIKIKAKELTVNNIEQIAIPLKEAMKTETLVRLLQIHNPKKAIVFCNTKRKVDTLLDDLTAKGYSVEALHSDVKQSQRDKIMKRLKKGDFQLLIATDVVARGIDIPDLELVINYDVPQEEEYYVHRIGRTGRNGSSGKAFTFVVGKEKRKLEDIKKYAHANIIEGKIPSVTEVQSFTKDQSIEDVQKVIDSNKFVNEDLLTTLIENNDNDIEVVAKALMTMLASNKSINNMDTINSKKETLDFSNKNKVKLFFTVGKKDSIKSKDIVGVISANCGIDGEEIGKINILDNFSFVEVPGKYVQDVLSGLKNKQIKNKNFNVEIANS